MANIPNSTTKITIPPGGYKYSPGLFESMLAGIGGAINYLLDYVQTLAASISTVSTNLAARAYSASSSCGTFGTTSTTYVDVTNLSVSITTTGGTVVLMLIPDGSGAASIYNLGTRDTAWRFLRDGSSIGESYLVFGGGIVNTAPLSMCERPAAGTYTYKVQMKTVIGDTARMFNFKLVAFEV